MSKRITPFASHNTVAFTLAADLCTLNVLVTGEDGCFQVMESRLVSGIFRWTRVSSPVIRLSKSIMLEMPKFSLDTDEDMIERMQELGIQHLFDPARCRLRRMTSAQNVVVSQMKHRAVIAVDEEGTTASAATNIGIVLTSAPFAPEELKVNRPFLFVLRDKTAHMNFFMGRYVNPQGDNVLE
ncbi:proteinase inhibitor i4 serpin [Plakobranchus ocellatus]|uniref:Proteinase inhibitor i4 serpin n=1 Tax=Plakobranchus ocellatus TaxID=259542 RepID=A0AAV3ZG26_9GAST|nr:proteinase inhibitor i4 serpin [Plakobranchus ocellatus]